MSDLDAISWNFTDSRGRCYIAGGMVSAEQYDEFEESWARVATLERDLRIADRVRLDLDAQVTEAREQVAALKLQLKTMTGNRDRGDLVHRRALAKWAEDHERVATLEGAIDDAPHAQGCARGVIAYSGRIDRFGTFPACDCWKADALDQEDDQ